MPMGKRFLIFLASTLFLSPFSVQSPARALTPAEVTLDALSQKSFNGSDLKLIKLLTQTSKYTKHSVTYRSDNLRVSGVLYTPKGKGPFPGVVLGHGYIDTRIYKNGQGMRREQDYLASRGFVVLHTDYRRALRASSPLMCSSLQHVPTMFRTSISGGGVMQIAPIPL